MILLQLVKVHKHYHLGDDVIRAANGIDFKVTPGEFISIMGPSGSGKSTFLHLASLLENPTTGKVFLKGIDVTHYNEIELAKIRNEEIGFIFQQFNLLPKITAWENVALPLIYKGVDKKHRQATAAAMLELVGLGDRMENARSQLSGGQQQRVAIARALVNNPAIIFADEPTGNLDSKSGEQIMELLVNLNKEGRTIVMVTHEHDIAAYARRNIILKDGRIIKDITKKSHRKSP